MNGGLCALISFIIIVSRGPVGNSIPRKILLLIALGLSIFGFIISLHSFESEKKGRNKIFKILEMMFCSFDIICGGFYVLDLD